MPNSIISQEQDGQELFNEIGCAIFLLKISVLFYIPRRVSAG